MNIKRVIAKTCFMLGGNTQLPALAQVSHLCLFFLQVGVPTHLIS